MALLFPLRLQGGGGWVGPVLSSPSAVGGGGGWPCPFLSVCRRGGPVLSSPSAAGAGGWPCPTLSVCSLDLADRSVDYSTQHQASCTNSIASNVIMPVLIRCTESPRYKAKNDRGHVAQIILLLLADSKSILYQCWTHILPKTA